MINLYRMKIPKQELAEYSKLELIALLTAIEEQYRSKSERLKVAHSKLFKARAKIQDQKLRLQHLRKRVVELTPKSTI